MNFRYLGTLRPNRPNFRSHLIYLNVAITLTFGFSQAFAAETYYNQHAIGWHWYNEPKEKKEQKNHKKDSQKITEEIEKDPIEEMQAIKTAIDRSLKKAILHPTTKNVRDYIELQNQMSDQAERFSKVWQLVLLEHPEFNYSIKHPTNNLASQIHNDIHHKEEEEAIKNFAKKSGLFFFYKSACPYCQKFAPTVKDFIEQYGISIIPISFDGDFLPEFPDSQLDKGQAAKFNVTVTPALFAVNPKTKKIIPIANGFVSQKDLRQRILDIATEGAL